AVKTKRGERTHAVLTQLRIVAALYDAEQRAVQCRVLEGALAALGPAQRQLHGTLELGALGRKPHAFVELHGNIGTEQDLHRDGALRRQLDLGAVEMRTERDTLVAHF